MLNTGLSFLAYINSVGVDTTLKLLLLYVCPNCISSPVDVISSLMLMSCLVPIETGELSWNNSLSWGCRVRPAGLTFKDELLVLLIEALSVAFPPQARGRRVEPTTAARLHGRERRKQIAPFPQ